MNVAKNIINSVILITMNDHVAVGCLGNIRLYHLYFILAAVVVDYLWHQLLKLCCCCCCCLISWHQNVLIVDQKLRN